MSLNLEAQELFEPRQYEVSDPEKWSKLAPRRGQVIVCKVPIPIASDSEVKGAFVIVHRSLMSDGSLTLHVKSLGSTASKTTTKLSSLFNRKEGQIHLCLVGGLCSVLEGITFHCQSLELFDGEGFTAEFVGTNGKRLLKQIVQGEEGDEEWVRPDLPGDFGDLPPFSPEPVGHLPTPGHPEAPPPDEGREPEEPLPGVDLRKRLEEVKRKELEKSLIFGQRSAGGVPPLEREVEPDLGRVPHLRSGQRLQTANQEIEMLLQKAREAAGPGKEAPRETTTPAWMNNLSAKAVGSQLALRAAATSQGVKRSAPGLWTGGGRGDKKKKKKKSKKKKKKKEKKKKKRRGQGGDPGGGDPDDGDSSSSSSSTGSSSSSESVSSGASGFLPPLRRKSDHRPGSVLQLLLNQIEENLAELQGADTSEASVLGGTKVVSYYHLLLKGNGLVPSSRDGRELYLLSVILDMLRLGMLDRVGDGLAARFLSIQQAVLDGHWGAARYLEIHTPEMSTAAGAAMTLAARRHARVIEKARGSESWKGKGTGSRSSWGGRGRGDWTWHSPEEGKKGKGKKGKPGKGKNGTWTGKTQQSWSKPAEKEKGKKEEETK